MRGSSCRALIVRRISSLPSNRSAELHRRYEMPSTPCSLHSLMTNSLSLAEEPMSINLNGPLGKSASIPTNGDIPT